MTFRFTTSLAFAFALAALAPLNVVAQTPAPAAKRGTVPRAADGHPDLQGIWTNATITPLERPAALAGKEFLTPEEAAAFEKQVARASEAADRPESRRQGDPGSYNQAWMDRGTHVVKTRRTSLVVDPPDGRVPPLTAEAQKIYDRNHTSFDGLPADNPEDRLLTERCILFGGAGPPMLPEPYNNNYEIVQTPDSVLILAELNHETRIVPVDGRPHLPQNIHQWTGDSRGHWEGDTLVVESSNFKFNQRSRFGVAYMNGMSDQNLRVTERFTRTDPDTIMYRATVSDPTVYTKPWTVELSMAKRTDSLFEYACHEGNYGMLGILGGARAAEKAAAAKK